MPLIEKKIPGALVGSLGDLLVYRLLIIQ